VQSFLVVVGTPHLAVIKSSLTPPLAAVEARIPSASAGVPPLRNEEPSLGSGFQIPLRTECKFSSSA